MIETDIYRRTWWLDHRRIYRWFVDVSDVFTHEQVATLGPFETPTEAEEARDDYLWNLEFAIAPAPLGAHP